MENGPVEKTGHEQLEVQLLSELQAGVGAPRFDELPQIATDQEEHHDHLGERYPFRTPDFSETKVLAFDSTLGGLSEPLPKVGVDFASPLSQFFIVELAVTDRPRIFTYRAYEPPGQLIRMV